ncbi:MAG: hypothetical protein IPG22_16720 [Acidobacteria bacterium]|nr:hypothetical protein [Acidobacteriota bacterium]
MAERINVEQLRKHDPNNPMLAFMPSIMARRCRTGALIFHRIRCRRELEEFSILGDVVLRIADELEPEAVDQVRNTRPSMQ